MGYVAIKGGTEAIEASIRRLTYERLRSRRILDVRDVEAGMRSLIDQVMSEGSLYSPSIAALCIKQAEGSPEEAVFILRAYRSTLSRNHYSDTVNTEEMRVERRISASFKEIPGGQILGSSSDYTHRLIDHTMLTEDTATITEWVSRFEAEIEAAAQQFRSPSVGSDQPASDAAPLHSDADALPIGQLPKVLDYLRAQGLISPVESDDTPPADITKTSLNFPARRSQRLQILTRGQTGALTALGYASLRGYGPLLHPTVGELRVGCVPVSVPNPFHGSNGNGETPNDQGTAEEDSYYIGEIRITEVESVVPVSVPRGQGKTEIEFDLGYGVCFGQNETKAIAMSLLDQCLENPDPNHPTHDEEFVLLHIDSVEATGFISHLKLPHYVTFQSELDSARRSRRKSQVSVADRGLSVPQTRGNA